MRNGAIAVLLVVAILAGAGAGFVIGNANERLVTSVLTTTSTSYTLTSTVTTATTTVPSLEPCHTLVWNESFPTPYIQHTPVLLMRPNTTGYVCVTFQSAWQGNQSLFASDSHILDIYLVNGTYTFGYVRPINWECKTTNGTQTCNQVFPHSLLVTSLPESIRPSAATNYVTIIYAFTALSNSTGFYDETAPWVGCLAMPMAVGYPASQVSGSNFTQGTLAFCPAQPFLPVAEYTTGMNVTYVGY